MKRISSSLTQSSAAFFFFFCVVALIRFLFLCARCQTLLFLSTDTAHQSSSSGTNNNSIASKATYSTHNIARIKTLIKFFEEEKRRLIFYTHTFAEKIKIKRSEPSTTTYNIHWVFGRLGIYESNVCISFFARHSQRRVEEEAHQWSEGIATNKHCERVQVEQWQKRPKTHFCELLVLSVKLCPSRAVRDLESESGREIHRWRRRSRIFARPRF